MFQGFRRYWDAANHWAKEVARELSNNARWHNDFHVEHPLAIDDAAFAPRISNTNRIQPAEFNSYVDDVGKLRINAGHVLHSSGDTLVSEPTGGITVTGDTYVYVHATGDLSGTMTVTATLQTSGTAPTQYTGPPHDCTINILILTATTSGITQHHTGRLRLPQVSFQVKCSANDTTPDYLTNQLADVAGTYDSAADLLVTAEETDDGDDESVKLRVDDPAGAGINIYAGKLAVDLAYIEANAIPAMPVYEATSNEAAGSINAKRVNLDGTLSGSDVTFDVLAE